MRYVSLKLIWFFIFFMLGALGVSIWCWGMGRCAAKMDIVEVLYYSSVSITVILTLIFLALQFHNFVCHERKRASFAYLERWNTADFREVRQVYYDCEAVGKEKCVQDFCAYCNDRNRKVKLFTLINFWQEIYLALSIKHIDEGFTKECFEWAFRRWMECFGGWFKTISSEDPFAYDHIRCLANKWGVPFSKSI